MKLRLLTRRPPPLSPASCAISLIGASLLADTRLPSSRLWSLTHLRFSAGEHIDYSCFPVLPTAVTADILIACSSRPSTSSSEDLIVVENVDERYARTGFTPRKDEAGKWQLDVDRHKGGWVNFVKAGFCGVLEDHLPSSADPKPMAADLLYTGSVPDGAGLSSSAAMVVGSTLAFLVLNGKADLVDSGGLVRMAVANERVVGVNSGGMDQAASVLSTASSALLIDFWPQLEAKEVPVPKTARFVISVRRDSTLR